MENLLNRAYFQQHCHECGHSYALTLYHILQQHRIAQEWQNLQGKDINDADTHRAIEAVPQEALEELERAWWRVAEAAESAGLEILVAPAPGMDEPHHH